MQYSLRILEYISLLKAYSLIKLLIKLIIITLMCFCYYFAIIFTPNSEFEKEITENRKLYKKPLQVDKTGLKRAEQDLEIHLLCFNVWKYWLSLLFRSGEKKRVWYNYCVCRKDIIDFEYIKR